MSIDELLDNAQQCLMMLENATGKTNLPAISAWANAAQAYAATAQAMMLAQMTDTIERPDMPDRRILNVDTGN